MTHGDDTPGRRQCAACGETVPAARFCGACGADLDGRVTGWSVLLRPGVFANAHREPIWLPRISSTLLPRIPGRTRKPFRLGMIFVLLAIAFFSAVEKNGPLGVFAVIGWPLIFLIYTWESDVFRDIPARILAVSMMLGVASGVGWWLGSGKFIAGTYGVSTGSSLLLIIEGLNVGFLISLVGGVLMLLPAVVTRLFAVPVRESLDGFVLGAFGALWYSTAAATTILAPQFAEGLIKNQSAARMLEDAITYGVVGPIITIAAGGLLGLLLWFTPDRRDGRDPRRARAALAICALTAFLLYLAVWRVDVMSLPRTVDIPVKLALALLALITVRTAVQIALLHDAPDPADGDPILCVHCERVVPDMPFCVACGSAARASSRSSRRLRQEDRPVPEVV